MQYDYFKTLQKFGPTPPKKTLSSLGPMNVHVTSKNKWQSDWSRTYHKSTDASLRRFPFEAAVDVVACVDQEHDAASNSVEVA